MSEVKIRESQYNELKAYAQQEGITVLEAIDRALTASLPRKTE